MVLAHLHTATGKRPQEGVAVTSPDNCCCEAVQHDRKVAVTAYEPYATPLTHELCFAAVHLYLGMPLSVCLGARRTLAMLEESGFQAYAPDWPGHGSSSKPSSSSFDYSQEAYINALDAFVEAVGIKKPFALVVQVRSCSQPAAIA